jgi:hypothetical protein
MDPTNLQTAQLIFAAEMGAGAAFAAIFSALSVAFGSTVGRNYARLIEELHQRPPFESTPALELLWLVENLRIAPRFPLKPMLQPAWFRVSTLVIIFGSIVMPMVCLVQGLRDPQIVKLQVTTCCWIYYLGGLALLTATPEERSFGLKSEWKRVASDEEMFAARSYARSTAPADHAKLGQLVRDIHGRLAEAQSSENWNSVSGDDSDHKSDHLLTALWVLTGIGITALIWV